MKQGLKKIINEKFTTKYCSKSSKKLIDITISGTPKNIYTRNRMATPKKFNKSIENETESKHKKLIRHDLKKLREKIEEKFARSEFNRTYVFPRTVDVESQSGKSQVVSCIVLIIHIR